MMSLRPPLFRSPRPRLASTAAAWLAALGLAFAASAQLGLPPPKPKAPEENKTVEVKPRAGEVRAVWLRLNDGDAIATPAKTAETMRRLKDTGLNTVYVTVWQDGFPLFPSEVMQKAGEVRISPALTGARDLLSEVLIEGHRNGLLVIACFEGGLIASPATAENPLRRLKKDWLLRDAKGGETANGGAWMNPVHPDVKKFMIDLVLEAADRYDLDGIQFDERMCWGDPTLGFDDTTRAAYSRETGGQALPTNPKDPGLNRWRAEKGVRFVRELASAVKEKHAGLIVSMAAPTQQAAMDGFLCDWPAMVRAGLMDEFVIKCHRPDVAGFTAAWNESAKLMGGRRPECVVGVRAIGGEGPDLPWADVQKELAASRDSQAAGFVVSSSRAVLFTYAAAFNDFFAVAKNGRVRHPLRALDWRPGPLKPERMNYRGEYLVTKGFPSGFFRAIVATKEPGVWIESSIKFSEGMAKISKEGAAALQASGTVEFLVDRRNDNLSPIPDPNAPPPPPPKPAEPRKRDKPPAGGGG
ncbi:MAG: glycoside hydrolase family 10 protein [Polaromonas sp.]